MVGGKGRWAGGTRREQVHGEPPAAHSCSCCADLPVLPRPSRPQRAHTPPPPALADSAPQSLALLRPRPTLSCPPPPPLPVPSRPRRSPAARCHWAGWKNTVACTRAGGWVWGWAVGAGRRARSKRTACRPPGGPACEHRPPTPPPPPRRKRGAPPSPPASQTPRAAPPPAPAPRHQPAGRAPPACSCMGCPCEGASCYVAAWGAHVRAHHVARAWGCGGGVGGVSRALGGFGGSCWPCTHTPAPCQHRESHVPPLLPPLPITSCRCTARKGRTPACCATPPAPPLATQQTRGGGGGRASRSLPPAGEPPPLAPPCMHAPCTPTRCCSAGQCPPPVASSTCRFTAMSNPLSTAYCVHTTAESGSGG